MSGVETVTILISILGTAIATGAAISARRSAVAAKTQAEAAEKQATHAETQAAAAVAQGKAAERQVEIMRLTMRVDHIATAIRYRRVATDLGSAINDARIERARGDGNRIAAAMNKIRQLTEQLEDCPPVFPKSVRILILEFADTLARQSKHIAIGNETPEQESMLKHDLDRMLAAIHVAVTNLLAELEEL